MALEKPAMDPSTLPARTSSGYPSPFRERVLPREKRALGDALGLTKIGVNLTTLMPGKESALRHWHTKEDELIFILEGEVVLVTDRGEQTLVAGTYCAFPAGVQDGHHMINRTDKPARYLEISNRDPEDGAEYPDDDLHFSKTAEGGFVFAHKDRTPY